MSPPDERDCLFETPLALARLLPASGGLEGTRMPGGVGAGGEKPPATRLAFYLALFFQCSYLRFAVTKSEIFGLFFNE